MGFFEIIKSIALYGIIYFIVSNTAWLLLGSKFLQWLPGVGDKSVSGTIKISIMIMSVVIGTMIWLCKKLLFRKISFKTQISNSLKHSSTLIYKIKIKLNM